VKAHLLAFLFATVAALGAAVPASAASLRANVVVDGDTVKLGDLFEDAGAKADTPVLYSPAPGRQVTLNAQWLAQVARMFQVAWRPLSQYDHATVQRAGKMLTAADVMPVLKRALVAQGMEEHADVALLNPRIEVNLPISIPATVEIQDLTYDKTTHAFNGLALAGGRNTGAERIVLQGRTFSTSPVPVLRRPMSNGQIIRKDDLDTAYWRNDQLGHDVVMSAGQIVGRTPQSFLRANEPIRQADTRAPILVTRNSQIIIRLEAGPMTLTVQGKSLDEGARGDVVRVQNLQSNKTIEATVAGPDLVTVSLGPRLAAATN
jgi:flagellar basal body P-ring formation protein FlgA